MTVFCPNCGKPNTDQASNCVACGHELKPAGRAAKFKGTMMMTAAQVGKEGPAGASPQGPPAGAQSPEAGTSAGGGAQAGSPGAKPNLAFQQTMLGPISPPGSGAAPGGPGAGGPSASGAGGPSAPAAVTPPTGSSPVGGLGPGAPGPAVPGGPAPLSGGEMPAIASGGTPAAPSAAGPAPGGGFGAPPAGSGPSGGPPAGGKSPINKKVLLMVGLGCLGLMILTCSIGGFLVCRAADEATDQIQEGFGTYAAEAGRISLTVTLGGIQMSCASDPSGAGAANFFHPSTYGQLQAEACQVTAEVASAFADADRTQAQSLDGTGDESFATNLDLDPEDCTRFISGAAKIVSCSSDGETKIVHMENIASLH